jgi:dienelactone hydrolase
MLPGHFLDHVAAFASGRRRVWRGGWGDEGLIDRLATVARFEEPPPAIDVRWQPDVREGAVTVTDGWFDAPVAELPPAARRALVRRLSPAGAARGRRPAYVVLGSSGDEGWPLRDRVWRPLVARGGLEAIFLENALYGRRRPPGQKGADLRTVAEQLLMNVSMVEEARALLDHLTAAGHDRVGVAGYSMGGSMAALVAAVTPRPLAAAIFAAGLSGGPVFTEGLLSLGIDWAALGGDGARARIARIFGVADLDRHAPPRRPEAAVLVAGRSDGYVFAEQVEALHARWRGSELRWVESGHAGTLLLRPEVLRRAAEDAMDRLREPAPHHFTSSSSTSKTSVALGGMAPGKPRSP